MSEIKVTHQGYDINYSENEDIWRCWDLNVEAASLSKAKQKINKIVANALKNMDIECYLLSRYGGSDIEIARITSRDAKTGEFWVVKTGNERRERVKAEYLIPYTKEIADKLEEVKRLSAAGRALYKQAEDVRKSIKKQTPEECEAFLALLVKTVQEETD